MSELDLGSTPTHHGGNGCRPGPAAGGLVLAPPAPVPVVKEEEAAGAIPVDDATKTALQQKAAAFAEELAAIDVRSPEFTKKIDTITSMGDKDLRASANVSSRMLDRPAAVDPGRARAAAVPTRRPGSRAPWSTCGRRSPSSTRTGPIWAGRRRSSSGSRAGTRSSATSPSTSRRSRT